MKKSQWLILSISSNLLGGLFMKISLQWKLLCNAFGEATMSNIFACIRGEIFAPLPYIFFGLSTILFICFCLEWSKW